MEYSKSGDYDTEHDFYWYLQQDGSRKLAGLGGVFNPVNMDVYHYTGKNPVKLVDPDGNQSFPFEIGNPFSFMMQLLKDKYEATFNETRNVTTSASIGFATGFIKGFFGPDFTTLVEKYGKEIPGFYPEIFNDAINSGEFTGQIAGLLNFATGTYQSGKEGFKLGYDLGKSTVKGILKDPGLRKDFALGFAKGLTPSVKPPKFSSLAEGLGYFLGYAIYEDQIKKFNNELNK